MMEGTQERPCKACTNTGTACEAHTIYCLAVLTPYKRHSHSRPWCKRRPARHLTPTGDGPGALNPKSPSTTHSECTHL